MSTGRANRVAPDGSLHAVPERGAMFGNRGALLDAHGRLARHFAVRRWIVCVLEFRGRARVQWRPGLYTELYFLDEATAFAAGHRPCAECRRPAYNAFRAAWQRAAGLRAPPSADEMDLALHADRLVDRERHRTHEADLADLPDGTVIELAGGWWLVDGAVLRHWTFAGYGEARDRSSVAGLVVVLTPRVTVAAMRAGYRPGISRSG